MDEIDPPIDTDDETGQDTGTETNPEDTFWRDWFENYNEGQGTAYLEQTGTRSESGDPRFPALPDHFYVGGASYGPFQGIYSIFGA